VSGEFVGTTHNLSLMPIDGEMTAIVEVVVLCRKPVYLLKGEEVVKMTELEELRFFSDSDRIKTLIEHLADMADQAKEMKGKFQLKEGAE